MPPRKSTKGNPPPPLTQDTVNRMIYESVKAAIRAERERVQNEANRVEGPNVAPVARKCTFADFMKCSPITTRRNEGVISLIRWKTWAEMKVMMTEEFCPPEEIQRMESELWNLRVKEMDISSYTTRFNELVILCPGMVPTERKKVEAYIRGLSKNIKGEVTSSEPATLSKAPVVTCYGRGEKGHIKTNCPARNNPERNEALGQAYALRDGDQNLGPNVVTGMFLLNNHYARVLFDSGLKKSQEKDKIGSKPDKNGKRGEAEKSLKQLHYRFNPRCAIKECSSCGTLYTRDCVCSIGTVEDKILVSKPPKNYARCTRCGYLVDGPNCQGCALLRQELEENLDKSFVDKIIFRAPDSPNQFHCFHYIDVLMDGEACKRCTCTKYGSGLGKGLCYICGHNQNSLNDSQSISETSSQSPPNINHCCYECGDPLDGIFCKCCTCKFCGKDAHIGYNCPSKVLVISNPAPCNNQIINELPKTLPIFHPTFHSEAESPFTLDSTPTYVDESPNVFNPPPQSFVVTIKTLISCKIFKMSHNNILVVMIAGLLMTLTNPPATTTAGHHHPPPPENFSDKRFWGTQKCSPPPDQPDPLHHSPSRVTTTSPPPQPPTPQPPTPQIRHPPPPWPHHHLHHHHNYDTTTAIISPPPLPHSISNRASLYTTLPQSTAPPPQSPPTATNTTPHRHHTTTIRLRLDL
nr:hypothetical protein [Tanacetum cinerariifolium]